MSIKRLIAITFILICTTAAWVILGASLQMRTALSSDTLGRAVAGVWGPPMTQQHPVVYYLSPGSPNGRHLIQPKQSGVKVALNYEPKKRGLLWYRTYVVDFQGDYTIENPTPITQTIYVKFQLPTADASYNNFSFVLNGKQSTDESKAGEGITEAVTLEAGASAKLTVGYKTRGTDYWGYAFGDATRIRNFQLGMSTDFSEINFPSGTGSATTRNRVKSGWDFTWLYPDVIGAQPVGMNMPNVLNPGPVASRIAYFAPVSLLFFFAVLLIMTVVMGVSLHPVNYFFLASGMFAFQLLFAYLVDLISLNAAFVIAAAVSLLLVSGYLYLAAGSHFARLAAFAQFAYMVLFSYSFFFDGLTGLTITIGAIITLAILMASTARINWSAKFTQGRSPAMPPPISQE
ncbi:MAG: inner membrane CreD family protein [Verrucomicrobiota bacterium]